MPRRMPRLRTASSAGRSPARRAVVARLIWVLPETSVKYGRQGIASMSTLCSRGIATISEKTSQRAMWLRVSLGR